MDVADFAKHIYKILKEREEQVALVVTSGGVPDHGQYLRLVGELQGLSYAKEEIKSLLGKHVEDGEDIIGS
jgi:hypothetical protein